MREEICLYFQMVPHRPSLRRWIAINRPLSLPSSSINRFNYYLLGIFMSLNVVQPITHMFALSSRVSLIADSTRVIALHPRISLCDLVHVYKYTESKLFRYMLYMFYVCTPPFTRFMHSDGHGRVHCVKYR